MYRPSENSNRVKSIKSKFENIENKPNNNEKPPLKKNGLRSDLIERGKTEIAVDRQNLSRQLSDPAKRNIKRTPAFRFDSKNTDKTLFQRTNPYNKSYYIDKIEQFNSALKNCDTNRNIINRTEIFSNEKTDVPKLIRPALIKSKSSHDFAYIRSKFDRKIHEEQTRNNENQRKNDVKSTNLASLYTEPVPKSQRNKLPVISDKIPERSGSDKPSDKSDIHSANTLRICDNDPVKGDKSPARSDNSPVKGDNSPARSDNDPVKADNTPAKRDNSLARSDNDPVRNDNALNGQIGLTDTLKAALKKPLPKGPAPVKPPRTFEHIPGKQVSQKNPSFLHNLNQQQKEEEKPVEKPSQKHDPRYMLNKLENALRNNRINRSWKQKQETSTTSGEDSDDSVLFKSKTSKRELPSIPDPSPDSQNSFNLNCLNGLALCKTTYETIKEPNSLFFVSCKKEEPVYAEPFNFLDAKEEKKGQKSLYYMSTPLLGDEGRVCGHNNMDDSVRCDDGDLDNRHDSVKQKQISAENSSLSSFTSDLESAASTPLEEHNGFENTPKIKHLINTFETKNMTKSKDSPPPVVSTDSTHRIEDLKMTLQKTLERCFDGDKEDSEQKERKVSVDTIISKFQTYVKTMPKYQKPKVSKDDRLFYCCLIVGWDSEMPQIKFKFPAHVKIPDKIEDLCYPEAASGPLDISDNAQCYSLVITNDKGERTFGYCRRVIPEGSTKCIPLAYCILSKHRAPRFYKKILMELESRHGIPDKLRDELISEFYFNKFPRPGESIKINLTNVTVSDTKGNSIEDSTELDLTSYVHVNTSGYGTLNKLRKNATDYESITINSEEDKHCSSSPSVIVEKNGRTELILTLHQDSRYEEADLKPLHKLQPDILLKIFASLLLERKVILISCVISKLSCSVDALQSILYPFSWPHTFIPILPQCLWDVVESPTPVICGILSVNVVNNHKIEHGIVVDLDEGNILCEEGDENSILSDSMKKAWHQGISLANTVRPDHYAHSVYLSDAYIKVFIASLKHYKNHIIEGSFDKEGFIKNGKTKGIKRFLKWFTETTMFMSFIDTVLSNPESFALFDKKIEMYGSEESNVILTKLLEWKK